MVGREGLRVRVSDEILGTFVPIGVYWLYSGLYCLLNDLDRYRMHSRKDEETKNAISKGTVIRGVLFQQSIQAAVSILLFAEFGRCSYMKGLTDWGNFGPAQWYFGKFKK